MAKCNIVRIEEGKDQFTVLLEDVKQGDINQLCYALAERTELLTSVRHAEEAIQTGALFEVINTERLKS